MAERKMLVDYPYLMKEWDTEKNVDLDMESIVAGSHKKAWWVCDLGHSYETKISLRKQGNGCPYCSNQKVLRGFNDFESQNPELMVFWDDEKNVIEPYEITSKSGRKLWWKCEKDHSFERSAHLMCRGQECPYCLNKKVLEGFNDAGTIQPVLFNLWNDKNEKSLTDYVYGSAKKVWWRCKNNHEFVASIRDMVKKPDICAVCSNKKVSPGYNDLATTKAELLKHWDYGKNIYSPYDVTLGRSADKTYFTCDNNHSFSITLADVHQGKWCKQCVTESYASKGEIELASFLVNIGKSIHTNTRSIIAPYELDIYLPGEKIALEFNGLYWHGEKYMNFTKRKDVKNYHYNKWKMCQDKGIQLITIWEDDWQNNQELIKTMLSYKLGVAKSRKIPARKTIADLVKSSEVSDFLELHHIQGAVSGSYNVVLKNDAEIVSMAVFKQRSDTEFELLRYASSCSVQGGLGKILSFVKKNNPRVEKVVTFSDNEISTGNLYEKTGFVVDGYLDPDYKYVYRGQRTHKFLFRKKRFENDSELLFDKKMTEKELASLNGIDRVWDCGKVRWVKYL